VPFSVDRALLRSEMQLATQPRLPKEVLYLARISQKISSRDAQPCPAACVARLLRCCFGRLAGLSRVHWPQRLHSVNLGHAQAAFRERPEAMQLLLAAAHPVEIPVQIAQRFAASSGRGFNLLFQLLDSLLERLGSVREGRHQGGVGRENAIQGHVESLACGGQLATQRLDVHRHAIGLSRGNHVAPGIGPIGKPQE